MAEQNVDIQLLERLLAVEQYEEVVKTCDAVQLNEELPKKFWFCKARALEGLGRVRRAIECYRMEIASVRRVPPHLLAHVGSLLMDVGQYHEALVCLQRSCEMERTVDSLVLLASASSHLGRHADALKAIEAASEEDPSSSEAWHNLGAYLLNERPGDAEAAFRRALDIDSDRPVSYGGVGKALLNQGRFEEAIRAAQEGLQLDTLCGLCHIVVGEAMDALGRTHDAEAAFIKAFHSDGYDKAEALLALARLSESSGRLDAATSWLGRGARAWPDDTMIGEAIDAFIERHGASAAEGLAGG